MNRIPKKYIKGFVNLGFVLIIVLGCIFVAPKILWALMPFIIGWGISLLANPVVHFFEEKIKIKRKAGSALVIISVIAGICLAIYAIGLKLVREVYGLLQSLPEIWQSWGKELESIGQKWYVVVNRLPSDLLERAEDIGSNVGGMLTSLMGEMSVATAGALSNLAQNIPTVLIAVIMCLLSAYFFVAEKEYTNDWVKKHVPTSWRKKCILMKDTILGAIGGYLKAQFKIEIWIYLIIVAGFLILKVQYGYLIAFLMALLDILPVFGTGAVLIPWAIFKFLSGQYIFGIGLLVIWGVSQLTRQIIQPKIVGDSMGMPPIPTLILLYLGYQIAGMIGMIVAVPLGILVLTMDEAGFFDNIKNSVKILWHGFNQFRRLTPEDLEGIASEAEEENK